MAKETVAIGQEPPCPAVRKRKKRPPKSGVETVTTVATQKVRSHRTGFLPFRTTFSTFFGLMAHFRILKRMKMLHFSVLVKANLSLKNIHLDLL